MLSLFDVLEHILHTGPSHYANIPTLPSNQSTSSSSSSSSSSISLSHQPTVECNSALTTSSSHSVPHLHTPLSLPMDPLSSRRPPTSPPYQPQAGPSSAQSSHCFHAPPSAPPLVTSPVYSRTPQPRAVFSQTLSDCCLARPPSPVTEPVLVPPPPTNKVAEFAAQMICYLWFAEPSSLERSSTLRQTTPSSTSPQLFPNSQSQSAPISTAQLVPNPEFVVFIHNVLNTILNGGILFAQFAAQLSHSVVLLALFYIHRLKCLNPIKPNPKSEYRIGVVSLMLANKMLDDHTYTAKTWSDVSRLPLASLNDGEIEFLQGLNFELHVNIRDFSAWFRLLHGMVHLKDRHTANALASGPRTRWFKKMRVVSGEGLNVLEGLVSPIRNSSLMKEEEDKATKAKLGIAPPTPSCPPAQSTARQSSLPSRPSADTPVAQRTHPYNLRRSARNGSQIPSTRSMHSLKQSNISPSSGPSNQTHYPPPSWGPSPLVPSAYSRPMVPLPNFTPLRDNGQRELADSRQKGRAVSSYQPYHSTPTPTVVAGDKRHFSETVDSQDATRRQSRKRVVAPVSTPTFFPHPPSSASSSTTTSRKLSNLSLHHRLPPISLTASSSPPTPSSSQVQPPQYIQLTSQESSYPALNYLGNAIVPLQPGSAHQGTELYFHSLTAGHRGPGQLVRQDVRACLPDSAQQVYVFGSQPWRQGTPMDTRPLPTSHHNPGSVGIRLMVPNGRGCVSQQSSPAHHHPLGASRWSPPALNDIYPTNHQGHKPKAETLSVVLPPIYHRQQQPHYPLISQSSPVHSSSPDQPFPSSAHPIGSSTLRPSPTHFEIPVPVYSNFSNAGMPSVIWHDPNSTPSSTAYPALHQFANQPRGSTSLPSHHLHPHQHQQRMLSRVRSVVETCHAR
ncbi:uncharacterized protein MELLADRAFT_87181 [Melampsora larici-populina 98AG31]|uniref:Cyclin N-terminal domain-containing protein n=1 Tax=Melampsora larici-populina (strain 98AG31 / pathotype 3-4-7) TaxID=747676 RepID=F4R4T6_MELLP|nr:uncharacterized protein MELLADRAFT_87181 [Melampsora larici-populina 98AG31]EGG12943.1 hypothetical protein MELLADRAFT_87181 [Melampsora larici-populina 98AG31]